MARYSVKKVDSRGKPIKNLLKWKREHPGELYHDSMTNYLFYKELTSRKIEFEYQTTFVLQPAFKFTDYVTRKVKGEAITDWFECSVQKITWSPDFVLRQYGLVIEAKGRIQETFPMKLKMFKYLVHAQSLGLKVIVLHRLEDLQNFLDKGLPKDGE